MRTEEARHIADQQARHGVAFHDCGEIFHADLLAPPGRNASPPNLAECHAPADSEFTHIVGTFRLVPAPVKSAALAAFRESQ